MIAIGRFKIESGNKLVYRVRHSKNVDIKISLNNILLNIKNWDQTNQGFKYKRTDTNFNKSLEINKKLVEFSQYIHEQIFSPKTKNLKLTSKWMREKYYDFFDLHDHNLQNCINDEPYFRDYFEHYINCNKKIEGQAKNGKNLGKNTVKGYKTMINYWSLFMNYCNLTDIKISDINFKIFDEFVHYQESEAKLGANSIDTNINKFKAILNHAKSKSLILHNDYMIGLFKFSGSVTNEVYLNDEEIDSVCNLNIPPEKQYLENNRKWFIIQLYTGLRVSDLFELSLDKFKNGFIETSTIKTKTEVVIPIFKQVQNVLDLNQGNLPTATNDVKYNKNIKEICKLAGINEIVKGSKVIVVGKGKNKKNRKIEGEYHKYELVSSHTSRRSMLTNLVKKSIPLSDLTAISGHSSVKTLENYIKSTKFEKANSVKEKLAALNVY
ncbi:site-specific tyrosine recombinase XerC [Algoriella xinjiangensis]|uniref:tyrosine-type recombinase/integrase n=1 Tax=Algoriella xinjiangensis TaxID=684065 RepID=UPI000F633618|nr:tyrosine-type recombinase/integrase [Algoriella xinjiangensis]VDH17601.1 site-specific tyrosine recombinase XerC [Algoriella xinjiangensis]